LGSGTKVVLLGVGSKSTAFVLMELAVVVESELQPKKKRNGIHSNNRLIGVNMESPL